MSNYEQDDGDQDREPGMFGRLKRKPKNAMPLQPIGYDEHGVIRFRKNRLVEYLLDNGPFDMNHLLALPGITNAEHMQFAQLIGYSVSGAGDLSFFDDETINEMDAIAGDVPDKKEKPVAKKKSRHEGRSTHRFQRNPREKLFAKEWKKLNQTHWGEDDDRYGTLAYMLAEDNNRPLGEVSDRDAEVAATVIQWLGSPVGQHWLREVQAQAEKLPE